MIQEFTHIYSNSEFHAFENEKDVGLKPGGDLKPQMPSLKDLKQEAAKLRNLNLLFKAQNQTTPILIYIYIYLNS